uniref:Uncharacterized protein n=1 Tax=Plectus sambesii TaxID=2011161 RepID=A0A914VU45_9BILA
MILSQAVFLSYSIFLAYIQARYAGSIRSGIATAGIEGEESRSKKERRTVARPGQLSDEGIRGKINEDGYFVTERTPGAVVVLDGWSPPPPLSTFASEFVAIKLVSAWTSLLRYVCVASCCSISYRIQSARTQR